MRNRIPKQFQKNKLNLVLMNDEVDIFKTMVKELEDSKLKTYLELKIKKIKC